MSVLAPPIEGSVDTGLNPVSYNYVSTATGFALDSTIDYRVEAIRPAPHANPSQIIALSREPCYFYIIGANVYSYMLFTPGPGALAVTASFASMVGFPAVGERVQLRAMFDKVTDTHSMWWRAASAGEDLSSDVGWNLAVSVLRSGQTLTASTNWLLTGANANNTLLGKAYRWYRRKDGVVDVDFCPNRDMAVGQKVTNVGVVTAIPPLVGTNVLVTRTPILESITFPGTAAQSLQTADTSVLDIIGDIGVVARVACDVWEAGAVFQTLLNKRSSATTHSYRWFVYDGALYFTWSPDGTDAAQVTRGSAKINTIVPGLTNGQMLWLATTLDVNNGAGGNTTRHWVSTTATDDPYQVVWTKIGSDQVFAGVTSIHSSTSPLDIGIALGGSFPFDGNLRYVAVRNAIGTNGVVGGGDAFAISPRSARLNATQLVEDTGKIVTYNASVVVNLDPTPDLIKVTGPEPRSWYGDDPVLAAYLGDTPVTTVYSDAA